MIKNKILSMDLASLPLKFKGGIDKFDQKNYGDRKSKYKELTKLDRVRVVQPYNLPHAI